ncbi:MAG: hypothetical protein IT204_23690 [Fimbriimonadaceae bacterium]|nr:hypothetical protein [Fimbriimonadaceae bacterium]
MHWIEFPDPRLVVCGLPFWAENSPRLWRLPASRREQYRPAVWGLGTSPAGGRVRFRSNTAEVALRLDYGDVGHMNNMHRIGQHAVDLYLDHVYAAVAAPLEGKPQIEPRLIGGAERRSRQIDLYLPLYHPVNLLAVGLSDDAIIEPPTPLARPEPVVFYGSSITQGGCAARAGNSYQAQLCRRLNLDHVNLGFSGNGIGEPEVAQTLAAIAACCYVIDYAQNCPTVAQMRETYGPLLATIRGQRATTPILCVTPIANASETWNPLARSSNEARRQVVREAVAARQAAGDQRIQVVEGYTMLGPDHVDGLTDLTHPNDLGFYYMANGLQRPLAGVLGL